MDLIGILDGVTYGDRVRELRKALGIEQDDLALRIFGSKKSQGNVAAIEAMAGRLPRPETVMKHAAALGCQVSALVGPVDDTWLDRARRGEFDSEVRLRRPPAARKT